MRRVAIVGGGVAGLTLAAALPPGVEVVLYEAQPDRVSGGAALGLWPAATRALTRLGVDLPARAPSRSASAGLFHVSGRRILRLPQPRLTLLPRPQLMAALEATVPDGVRRVHEEVVDPGSLDADLVVGADGVRSRVRPLVQSAERLASPWLALRGMTSAPVEPADVGEYWGRGRLFGLVPVTAGSAYWFTSHRSGLGPEPLDLAETVAEARAVFGGDAPVIRERLAGAGPETLATRIWTVPPLRRYARGRYVVVGDAAHATTPNLGRGAADAILDAVSLAAALQGSRTTSAALLRWQARRLPSTQSAGLAARALMHLATRS